MLVFLLESLDMAFTPSFLNCFSPGRLPLRPTQECSACKAPASFSNPQQVQPTMSSSGAQVLVGSSKEWLRDGEIQPLIALPAMVFTNLCASSLSPHLTRFMVTDMSTCTLCHFSAPEQDRQS